MSTAGSVTISYTTLAEVALVAALVGGIAYIGSSKSANQPHPTSSSLAPQPPAAGAKKSNKKKKGAKTAPTAVEPVVEAATAVKDHVVAGASAAVQRAQPAVQEAVAQVKQVATQVQEVAAGAATKKSGGGKKANKKGSPKPDATKPDATKHAEQKVVHEQSDRADMVDPKDHPQVARVMKVVGGKVGAAPPPPAPSAAQGDGEWESLEDDEGGWESVVSKKPSRPSTPSLNANGSSAAASRVVPGMPTAQMTKKQRENAAKKAKEQSAKDAANHEQEERLRQYRREQERAQLAAENAARARARPKSQNFFGSEPTAPAAKVLSGGMSASLDPTTGSLVWE